MKEVSHNEWMNTVKKLNEEQPSVIDLVNQQIESYENDKEGRGKRGKNEWGYSETIPWNSL